MRPIKKQEPFSEPNDSVTPLTAWLMSWCKYRNYH